MIASTIATALLLGGAPETPTLVHRGATPYVSMRANVTMRQMSRAVPKLFGELGPWMVKKKIRMAGPGFIRYDLVNMAKSLEIEVGFPVDKPVRGEGKVIAGMLPAGRYVRLVHLGDFSGLVAANGALQDWAKKKGLKWSMSGNRWDGRVEFYWVTPFDTPDKAKWKTEILYKVR